MITEKQKTKALSLGLKSLSLTNHKNPLTNEYDEYLLSFYNI